MPDNGLDENPVLDVNPEFFEETKKVNLVKPGKKFAPYSKQDRILRRKEVYRLHFENGLPGSRIAQLMSVDKNTIYADLRVLYAQLKQDILEVEFGNYYIKQMVRLENQRSRLAGYLEEAKDIDKKITVERLLADIDLRMLAAAEKVEHCEKELLKKIEEGLNKKAGEMKLDYRALTLDSLLQVSPSGYRQIHTVLKREGLVK
jgi:hypothetical protein